MIPEGNTIDEIKQREQIIRDFYREWKEKKSDCPLIEIDDDLLKKAESAYVLQEVRRGLK